MEHKIEFQGKAEFKDVVVPGLLTDGLVLHRDLSSPAYTVSHHGTTSNVVTVPSVKAGKQAVSALLATGIDWTVTDKDTVLADAQAKGLADTIKQLREEGVLC